MISITRGSCCFLHNNHQSWMNHRPSVYPSRQCFYESNLDELGSTRMRLNTCYSWRLKAHRPPSTSTHWIAEVCLSSSSLCPWHAALIAALQVETNGIRMISSSSFLAKVRNERLGRLRRPKNIKQMNNTLMRAKDNTWPTAEYPRTDASREGALANPTPVSSCPVY